MTQDDQWEMDEVYFKRFQLEAKGLRSPVNIQKLFDIVWPALEKNIGIRDAKPQTLYNLYSLSLTSVDWKYGVILFVFLTTTFHKVFVIVFLPTYFLHLLSHNVFLTTSFSQRLFHNVFLTTSFQKLLSLNVFLTTSFSKLHSNTVYLIIFSHNDFSQRISHNVFP